MTEIDPLIAQQMKEQAHAFSELETSQETEAVQEAPIEDNNAGHIANPEEEREEAPFSHASISDEADDKIPKMTFVEEDEESWDEASEENLNIPAEEATQNANLFADFLLDLYCNELPNVLHYASKVQTASLRVAEQSGLIGSGTCDLIDNFNERNKDSLKVSVEQREMIRKPLVQVLTVRGVSVGPEAALLMAVLISAMTLFMTFKSIKKESKSLTEQILEKALNKS